MHRSNRRLASSAALVCLLAACSSASVAPAPPALIAPPLAAVDPNLVSITLTEGTDMSAAVAPNGQTIIASIQGTLWSIPGAGGKATALTRPEMDAQEPAISPDGKLVAFYAFAEDGWSVWTMGLDGTSLTRRSPYGVGDARYPSFSADNTKLLYSTDTDGGYSAVSLDLASGARTVLVDAKASGYKPPTEAYFQKNGNIVTAALSPDGQSLAYVIDGLEDKLFVRALPEGQPKQIYAGETLGAPAWSVDGQGLYIVGVTSKDGHLAYAPLTGAAKRVAEGGDFFPFRPSVTKDSVTVTVDGQIKTFPLAGGAPKSTPFQATVSFTKKLYERRPYDFKEPTPHKALGIFDPALSPDGSKAAFTAIGDLWIADLKSGALTNLTRDAAVDLSPSFSPDGKLIAFVSDRDGKSDIWTVTPDGKAFKKLTDLPVPANAPAWSHDGKKIAFLKDAMASIFLGATVEVLDVKSGKITHVMDAIFGPSQPVWSPDNQTVAIVARKPMTSRFREGLNALMLAPADGKGGWTWVSPVQDVSLGRRQWNRPAWSSKGQVVYRVDGQLWTVGLDKAGKINGAAVKIADSGENPNWSADGSKVIFVDGDAIRIYDAATKETKTADIAPTWTRPQPATSYTIRVGKLFDAKSDAYQTNVDVVVEKTTITSVHPAGSKPVVGTLIDASARTMTPGLIEGHTHQSTSLGTALGQRWFSFGITSVRETGADPYEVVERREASAAGVRKSPRVFAAGPLNEGGRVSYGISETVGSSELAVAAVKRSTALKLDMMKSYVREDYTTQKTIIGEAHTSGIPISGHELYPALANGADQVEHVGGTSRRGFSTKITKLNRTYQDVVALLTQSGMTITPTLALHSRNGTEAIPTIQKTVKAIYDQGGKIMAGVDSPFITFADSLHTELRLYSEAGIPNAAVLKLATSGNAKLLNADSEIGTVEAGKVADLILIDGDPLADINDTRKVTWVMQGGEVVWEKK